MPISELSDQPLWAKYDPFVDWPINHGFGPGGYLANIWSAYCPLFAYMQ